LRGSSNVAFDFAEFTSVTLSFIGTSCAISDVIERIPNSFTIPGNDLLVSIKDLDERALVSELLRHDGLLKVIPVVNAEQAL
jgi:hypothetical protein